MLRKALVTDGGDSKFIKGDQVDYAELLEENDKVNSLTPFNLRMS